MPIGWAVLLSLFIAALIGTANGIIIAFVEAPPLFVTLAASFVIYGMAFWIAPAWVVYAPKNAPMLLYPGQGLLLGMPMPIIVFLVAAIGMHFFLSKTSVGRFVYAQGDNLEAARLAGIGLRPLIVLEYLIVALLAWLAGLVWIGTTGSMQMSITQGTMVFDVILVVVLGGISLIFSNPERLNAVSYEMWRAIPERIAEFVGDPAIRVVVLRGEGDKAFVSGADISQFEKVRSSDAGIVDYDDATRLANEAILGGRGCFDGTHQSHVFGRGSAYGCQRRIDTDRTEVFGEQHVRPRDH
jgi:hypothetical protein